MYIREWSSIRGRGATKQEREFITPTKRGRIGKVQVIMKGGGGGGHNKFWGSLSCVLEVFSPYWMGAQNVSTAGGRGA